MVSPREWWVRVTLATVVLLYAACRSTVYAEPIGFSVEVNTKKCFHEDLQKEILVDGILKPNFGQHQVISVTVWDPNNREIFRKEHDEGRKDGDTHFTFSTTDEGEYHICIHNTMAKGFRMARGLKRSVVLDLKIGHEAKLAQNIASKKHLEPIQGKLERLSYIGQDLLSEIVYQREIEADHQDLNEKTSSLMSNFGIIILICVGSLTAWQIITIQGVLRKAKRIS